MKLDFSKRIQEVPLRSIDGTFFRAVTEEAADYALEDGPAFARDHRYNLRERFGALYFGDRVEVCRATVQGQGYLTARARNYVLLMFEIHVGHVLDLIRPDSHKLLGIQREDLLRSREDPAAYEIPNAIASAAYETGRISGLLAPDVTETGSTLVLYPARLLSKDTVRLKQRVPF